MTRRIEELIELACSNIDLREALLLEKTIEPTHYGLTATEAERLIRWRSEVTVAGALSIITMKLCG